MTGKGSGKRGRPLGFRLSEESKRAISEAKKGQKHKEETKHKISRSLRVYFKKQNPLSEEITNTYCRADDDDLCDWVFEVREDLDNLSDVLTEKVLRNRTRMEITCGGNIEFFSHNVTPELIVLLKEYCKEHDLDPVEFILEVI
jgi:hypothetical protein